MFLRRCCWLVLGGFSLWAFAGGTISGGGKDRGNEGNPWFLQNRAVHYCIEKSDSLSRGLEEVRGDVDKALHVWTDNLPDYNDTNWGHPKEFFLTKTFLYQSDCQDADLKFRIGLPSPEPKLANYISLAYRYGVSADEMWANGEIWVGADRDDVWSLHPEALQAVIAHEVGHIFGISHALGGLMAEDFPAQILALARKNVPLFQNESLASNIKQRVDLFEREEGKICGLIPASNDPDSQDWVAKSFAIKADSLCLIYSRHKTSSLQFFKEGMGVGEFKFKSLHSMETGTEASDVRLNFYGYRPIDAFYLAKGSTFSGFIEVNNDVRPITLEVMFEDLFPLIRLNSAINGEWITIAAVVSYPIPFPLQGDKK